MTLSKVLKIKNTEGGNTANDLCDLELGMTPKEQVNKLDFEGNQNMSPQNMLFDRQIILSKTQLRSSKHTKKLPLFCLKASYKVYFY